MLIILILRLINSKKTNNYSIAIYIIYQKKFIVNRKKYFLVNVNLKTVQNCVKKYIITKKSIKKTP